MKIITVANQKGGVGKSTLATLLALQLKKKCKVCVVDTDPQQSLFKSINNINNILGTEVLSVYKSSIEKCLETIKQYNKFDVAVVDTMPSTDVNILDLLTNTLLTVVPTGVSTLDINAFLNTIKLLKAIKSNYRVVFNNVKNINDLNKVRDFLITKNIVDETRITQAYLWSRVAYSRLFENNLMLEDTKAKEELNYLMNELVKFGK